MARSYARIMTTVWRNADFRRLRGGTQRAYLLLVTQPDISAAGTLPLTIRRWAEMDSDTTVAEFARCLEELEAGRFIAVDRVTEEVLVRSFVKWDGGHGNSKRRVVIESASLGVASATLRGVMAAEYGRLGFTVDGLSDSASDAPPDTPPEGPSPGDRTEPDDVLPLPVLSQVDSPSDAPPDRTGQKCRVVGTLVTTDPTTHNPKTIPPTAAAPGAQQIVGAWIDSCRQRPTKRVIGMIAKGVKALLDEGIDPDDVGAGLARWQAKGNLHPSNLDVIVNEVRNGPRGPTGFTSPTDANIAAFLGGRDTGPPMRLIAGGAS